ncbi:immunoglobulin I-set domain protein [Streptomyces sp. LZ34]
MTDTTTARHRPGTGPHRRRPRPARPRLAKPRLAKPRFARPRLRGLLPAVALLCASVAAGPAVQAADTPKTGLGKHGQKLTVSASANLDPDGDTIRVTGEGYDNTKGIYVALCKDNGDNRIPTPCLGGADMTGGGGSSQWIVPKGGPYEGDLAIAYGDGGTFDVGIEVKAEGDGLDCSEVTCAVVTRVDHRAGGDRSQDVRIPVTFKGQAPGGGDPGDGDGGGVDVPAGTVTYRSAAQFAGAGKPLDVLLHPDSRTLYVGADNLPDTADVDERGLYVLDPGDGAVRSRISQAPSATGALRPAAAAPIAAPLPGDGVVYRYPLRGVGTAKDGDAAARGVWLTGAAITDIGPGTTGTAGSTVLVAQGDALSEIDTATGTARRTITLEGGRRLAVDPARKAAWSAGSSGGPLRRVDISGTTAFTVTATAQLPNGAVGFVETDPATGNVWVGVGGSVLVFDRDAERLATIEGTDGTDGADGAAAAAFDTSTGRAFVVRQDGGDTGGGDDNNGSLTVYDTTTYKEAAEPVTLAGNHSQSGSAALAVAPGGGTVYVTSPAEGKITKLVRRMSPKVTQAPTDRSARPGETVTFTAAAEGEPKPSVRWQVSRDGSRTWTDVEGATGNAYTFAARAAHDGYRYRAEFTNAGGTTRTASVTLTVTEEGDGPGGDGGNGHGDGEPSGAKTVTGPEGQKLTVTPVNNLAVDDQKLKITGSGYDETKGIYVALCVDNGDGELPTPCIGGVDMTGGSHTSAWISSAPPDYGEELAIPYGERGTFEVELTVGAKDEYTDCFKVTCVLATRADHTLSGDRSQDVKVPVSFVGQPPVDTDDDTGADDGGTSGSSGSDSTGGTASGGSSGGGATSTTGPSGSLAATGITVLGLAAVAALLIAAGWLVHSRSSRRAVDN